MIKNNQSSADIGLSDEAIDWIVYLSSGRATEQDYQKFNNWRRQSPQHEMAAKEAESLWYGIGSAGKRINKTAKQRHLTRRSLLGLSMAFVSGAALYQTGLIGPRLFADYTTGTGEQRAVTLVDGSVVTLNANSALSVKITEQERRLTLYEGQALFSVAKDRTRPFIVDALYGQTRALGTIFDIDIRPRQVSVTVIEGTVGVTTNVDHHFKDRDMMVVQANSRIFYLEDGAVSLQDYVDVEMETAWRRGKLIFNAKPLGDVIAELERYRSGKIILASDQLYALQITGIFDLTQPEEILQAIENTLPVYVTRLPYVTIIRPNSAFRKI
ncbi:FecR family protein [Paenochrobactrum pullorum]|uniref:FecR family protein n=1 Tax=Paenochrobactrum pullorum TaxID=1324351 RepID=UPI0035BBD6E1